MAFSNMISVDADGSVAFSENNGTYVETAPNDYVLVPGDDDGIYLWTAGAITMVADIDTAIPGGTGNFTSFSFFGNGLEAGRLAFSGRGSSDQVGVYAYAGGPLLKIADTNTAIPEGMGNFESFTTAYVDGTNYAFIASDEPVDPLLLQQGIYVSDGVALTRIADKTTTVPDIGGTYGWSSQIGFDDGNIAFWANVSGGSSPGQIIGGYTPGGGLTTLASTATLVPGVGTNFTSFQSPADLSGTTVVFRGSYDGGGSGFFTVDLAGGPITPLVSKGAAAPGGGGAFTNFGSSSIAGGEVAFRGDTVGGTGIYLHQDGRLRKVISTADRLEGRVITGLSVFENSFSGEYLAFLAVFADSSKGIYLLKVSELVDTPETNVAKEAALKKAALEKTIKSLTKKMKQARKSGKVAKAKRFLAKLKTAKKQLRRL